MRRGLFLSGKINRLFSGLPAVLFLAASLAACATTPAQPANVGQVLQQPEAFDGKRVELTGLVSNYQPAQGDVYRTLIFTLKSDSREILVSAAGYTAESIAKASMIVEQAYQAQEPITVAGKIKQPKSGPPELRLETVRYKGQEIKVSKGASTRPGGFSIGGGVVTGSIGIGATIIP